MPSTVERFRLLADALKLNDPDLTKVVLATLRVLLGGEETVRRYADAREKAVLDVADYIAAANAKAFRAEVGEAALALKDRLMREHPDHHGWWPVLVDSMSSENAALQESAMYLAIDHAGGARAVRAALKITDPEIELEFHDILGFARLRAQKEADGDDCPPELASGK